MSESTIVYKTTQADRDRDKLRRANSEAVKCECGGRFKTYRKSEHFKTLMHKKFVDTVIKSDL